MTEQHCIICGKPYGAGLHIMGCLICFPCEQKLLNKKAAVIRENEQMKALLRLYKGQETESL